MLTHLAHPTSYSELHFEFETALAKSLSLEVIAEGVETAVEYAEVSDCGCDEIQGYFFARPMQARGLSIWLSAKQRKANCGEVA